MVRERLTPRIPLEGEAVAGNQDDDEADSMIASNTQGTSQGGPIMKRFAGFVGTLALVLTVAVGFTGDPGDAQPTDGADAAHGVWRMRATGARIIGGYGQNFAYNGENVRALDGQAEVTLNTADGTGMVEITVRTTRESGPIRFSADQSFEGEIRLVQQLNTAQSDMARIEQEVWLHGDTGNEAPVMPTIFNYFATWGPSKIFVNGEEVVPMIGGHSMLSERARNAAGQIVSASGQMYSPMAPTKTGFTDRSENEFHFVAHTTQPDANNFPPHTAWIHLQFEDVEVLDRHDDLTIPYTLSL
jgi:hypothetical protein